MEQQTQEIDHSIRSTLVGASISAVAAFLGGLIGGTVGMASAGAAAALIVAKYIKRKTMSQNLFTHFQFNFLIIIDVIQSQRSVLYCRSSI